MSKETGFDKSGFIAHLEKIHPTLCANFFQEMLNNIIEFGLKHECVSKDQLAYWLSDMIPDVDFGEVAMFMEDGHLTAAGIETKREAIERLKESETYSVTFSIQGRITIDVKAHDFAEAKHEACKRLAEVDVGEIDCVSGKAVKAENETGRWFNY